MSAIQIIDLCRRAPRSISSRPSDEGFRTAISSPRPWIPSIFAFHRHRIDDQENQYPRTSDPAASDGEGGRGWPSRASPSSRSEEHTSELQSLMRISYAVFCLKKKRQNIRKHTTKQ